MKKRTIFVFLLVLLTTFFIVSCGKKTYVMSFDTVGGSAIENITVGSDGKVEMPPNPTKTGYTFEDWYLDSEYLEVFYEEVPIKENTKLYAKWIINQYTISFETNGGSSVSSITQDYNSTITEPTAPVKDGYGFSGWYTDEACQNKVTSWKVPAEDITYYAKWVINQNTIVFETDGGSKINPIVANYGAIISAPEEPTKYGYTFAGWYKDDAFLEAFTFTTMPKDSLTLYAKWEPISLTVNFISQDLTYEEKDVTYSQTVKAPTTEPTRTGYTFAGWYKADTLFDFNTPITEEIELVAHWTINRYTIEFDTNGGNKVDSITKDYHSTLQAPENPQKLGYTFMGWYKDKDFTEAYAFDTMEAMNRTLYAKFVANSYTVIFNANGGTGTMENETFHYDEEKALTKAVFHKDGYTFLGFKTSMDSEKLYLDEEVVKNLVSEGSVVLYAIWEASNYSIIFNANGGTGKMANMAMVYDQKKALDKNVFTKEGYTFIGWNTKEDGSGERYLDEALVQNLTLAEEVTLYAEWKANIYSITYQLNGGSYQGSTKDVSKTYPYDATIDFTFEPELTGYTFQGFTPAVPQTMPLNGITVKALWKANTYTVTFDSQGGNVMPVNKEVIYDEAYGSLPIPEKLGYTFLGWSTTKSDTQNYILENTLYQNPDDCVLYAKWKINTYTISFISLGGSSLDSITLDYQQTIPVLKESSKLGYTFLGWYEQAAIEAFALMEMPASDITLYARWEAITYQIQFNANGGEGHTDALTCTYDEETVLTSLGFTKTGYIFKEWNTKSDGTELSYQNEESVKNLASSNVILDLFAIWTPITYTITFDANGGEGTMDKMTMTYDIEEALNENTFLKENYIFAGWAITSTGSVSYQDGVMVKNLTNTKDANVTLYAKWTSSPASYTIQYIDAFDQTVLSKETIKSTSNDEVSIENYKKFEGYIVDEDNSLNNTSGIVLADNSLVLKQYYQRITYQVSYLSNTGEGIMANQTFTYKQTQQLTKNSFTKVGYTFQGWALSAAGDVVYTDELAVSNLSVEQDSVLKLYAKWEANSYVISFDSNSGEGTMDDFSMTYDLKDNLPKNEFTKQGYHFLSWNTASDGSGDTYSDEAFVLNLKTSGSVTFYAIWTPNEYTITYKLNGGKINNDTSDISASYPYLSEIEAIETPERTGYNFAGFSPLVPNTMPLNGITVTALWEAISYTVCFDSNSGTGTMENQTMNYDEERTLTANLFTKVGYHFLGWATSENGEVQYLDEATVKNLASLSKTITFYAIWEANSYNVSFDANGGLGTMETIELLYDSEKALTKNSFTNVGYTFQGWSLNETGEVVYVDNAKVLNLTSKMDESITFYAIWKANTYTLSFEANTGTLAETSKEVTYNKAIGSLPTPTKTGYDFAGWYVDLAESSQEVTEETIYTKASNQTIYAKYTIKRFDITFMVNGVEYRREDVAYGTILATLGVPTTTCLGYTFQKWQDESNKEVVLSDYSVKANETFTAVYEIDSYTVQFISQGKVIGSLSNMEYKSNLNFTMYIENELNAKQVSGLKQLSEDSMEYANAFIAYNNGDQGVALQAYLGKLQGGQTIFTDTQKLTYLASLSDSLAANISTVTALLQAGSYTSGDMYNAVNALYGVSRQTYLDKVSEYQHFVNSGNAPTRNGYVFNGWYLGDDTSYTGQINEIFNNLTPGSLTGKDIVLIVANWNTLDTVSGVSMTANTLTWNQIDTAILDLKEGETISVDYYLYDSHNSNKSLIAKVSNKGSYLFTAPGEYNVTIQTICNVMKNGEIVRTVKSDFSSPYLFNIELTDTSSDAEILSEGDYYYKVVENEEEVFYFFTNMKYQFNASNQFIITDSEGNETTSSYANTNKNVITIGTNVGSFYFKSGANGKVFLAKILPYLTQFELGNELTSYKEMGNPESTLSLYLSSEAHPYVIGINNTQIATDYQNNGFKFSLVAKTTGGISIDLANVPNNYFTYTFYRSDDLTTPLAESEVAIYDSTTGAWNFIGSINTSYTVKINIRKLYVPKKLRDTGVITEKTFSFVLNDCANVFTHETLKSVFADVSFTKGINLHANIKARLEQTQLYSNEAYQKNNPYLQYAATANLKDGSPINVSTSQLMRYAGEANAEAGFVYTRLSKTDLMETYTLNGNYFTIDCTAIPQASIKSIGNLSPVSGYEIANTQLAIFEYIVSDYQNEYIAKNTFHHESTFALKDLSIIGNTETPSVNYGLDSELVKSSIALMNKNSGAHCGIRADFGGTINLSNVILAKTTIGVYAAYRATANIEDTYIYHSWANSVYGPGPTAITIKNSKIMDSGGAAIHVEDFYSRTEGYGGIDAPTVTIHTNTTIENYIVGEEAWFKAYSMELAGMQMKTSIEAGVNQNGYTILKRIKNDITGYEDEKMNFILLTPPGGTNASDNTEGTKTSHTKVYILDDNGNGNVILGGSAIYPSGSIYWDYSTGNRPFALFHGGADGYFLYPTAIPGLGNSMLVISVTAK